MNLAELFVKVSADISGLERSMSQARQSLTGLEKVAARAAAALAGAFAAVKLGDLARDTANLRARFDTLGIVMNTVGRNAGYSAEQMGEFERSLRDTGISMVQSRSNLARMAQAQIDLTRSTELARIAQDAAVIGNINSSEAFERLVRGIQSAEVEILRNIGLNVSFERSYARLAAQLGKSAADLTETEKVQARVNAVQSAGAGIAGSYEASLTSAGKQMGSNTRLLEDLRVKLGAVFTPSMAAAVFGYRDALKAANEWADRMADTGRLETWGQALRAIGQSIAGVVRVIHNTFQSAAAILHGVFSTVNLMVVGTVNEGIRAVNALLRLASRLPGVQIGQLPNLDAHVATLLGEQNRATELFRKNMAEAGDAARGVVEAWKPVTPGVMEAGAAISNATDGTQELADAMKKVDEATRRVALSMAEAARGVRLTAEGLERFRANRERLREFLSAGGSLDTVTPRSTPGEITAGAAGAGGLGQVFGALKTQIGGLAASFGPLAVAALALKPVFDGFSKAIGPALEALAGPLEAVGRIIGETVAPVMEVFAPILELLAGLFKQLMEPIRLIAYLITVLLEPGLKNLSNIIRVITIAFSYIHQAIGVLVKALGDFVDNLVPDRISKVGKGLADMGQSMIDQARATRENSRVTDAATESVQSFASSMRNVPVVFSAALRRFEASTAGIGGGSGSSGRQRWLGTPVGASAPVVVTGPVTVVASDPADFGRQIEDYAADRETRLGWSRLNLALP